MDKNEKQQSGLPCAVKRDPLGIKSIQFKTWLGFVLLTVITLLVLWCAQIIFYTSGYQNMKKAELKRAGDEITDGLDKINLLAIIRNAAIEGGLSAVVFLGEESDIEVRCFSDSTGSMNPAGMDEELLLEIVGIGNSTFRSKVNSSAKGVTYFANVDGRGRFLVYGNERLSTEGNVYVCLISPYVGFSSTVNILKDQLFIVTIICLLISVLISYFISSKIARPITQFSVSARKLGRGDYNVRFDGNGWTEIDELAETLNYATEEMGKTENLRRDFMANVSHDMRTPLTMIKAYAELIKDVSGDNKDKRDNNAQIIIDEADRLASLVADILDLSKLQSGTEALRQSEFDIGALTSIVAKRFSVMEEKGGYEIKTEIREGLNVYCDPRRIEQVLYNLIGNALNYTGKDKKILIAAIDKGDRVRVEISDSGKGLTKEEIETVWERYYRANQVKRTTVGTGLGLSIVKNIFVVIQAEYGIESVLDEGTNEKHGSTFWFELPKKERQRDLSKPSRKERNNMSNNLGKNE